MSFESGGALGGGVGDVIATTLRVDVTDGKIKQHNGGGLHQRTGGGERRKEGGGAYRAIRRGVADYCSSAKTSIRRSHKQRQQQRDDNYLYDLDEEAAFRSCEFGTLAEQKDETFYDDRSDAEDDEIKGRLKFPRNKLYGRDGELARLRAIFDACRRCCGGESQAVFVSGYSGTGKSALVTEFTRQLRESDDNGSSCDPPPTCGGPATASHIQVCGKYSELKSSDPFHAVSGAMAQLVCQLLQSDEAELRLLLDKLAKVGISSQSENGRTLVDIIPQLAPLLFHREKQKGNDSSTVAASAAAAAGAAAGTCQDLSHFKVVFCDFVRVICSSSRPLVLFMDDVQWASATSLELIAALFCGDASPRYLVLIACYRLNEVCPDHPLTKVMGQIEEQKATAECNGNNGRSCVHHIELSNLSPAHVGQFIADSFGRLDDADEVRSIVDVVYSKTLGNIFFVIQALEELVRCNALYYDVMTFRWEWGDVSRVDLEKYLSQDVVEMVRSKISGLPLELQRVLTLMAYTSNEIDVATLHELLECNGVAFSRPALTKVLDRAVSEGVLLAHAAGSASTRGSKRRLLAQDQNHAYYQFSHDRVQEAASTFVAPGKDRDELLVRISSVLADRGAKGPHDNWMLFVAVHHLNSVHQQHIADLNGVARLNCRVAKLATRKASFPLACKLARMGVCYLDKETCWEEQYDLSLDLYNLLATTELALGNFDEALDAADQVLQNARSTEDQCSAHETRIAVTFGQNNHNHDMALKQCVVALGNYGVHLPLEPSIGEVVREQLMLRVALGNRSLSVLADLPVTRHDSTMKLFQRASFVSQVAQNGRLVLLLALRAVRMALKQGTITQYLPFMVFALSLPLRMKGKYDQAYACANTAVAMLGRFMDGDRLQIAITRLPLVGMVLLLRQPFGDVICHVLQLHWVLISHGRPYLGLAAARLSLFCFFAASLPLNSMPEPRLLQFQNLARDMGRNEFFACFQCMQQFVRNLRTKTENPTSLRGAEEMLGELEGNAKRMVKGDIVILRLQLAFIFDDETAMEDMLQASDEYPTFDPSVVRQHLRLAYVGLAGLILARREGSETAAGTKKKRKKYLGWGLTALNHFRKLDRFGSPNARPIHRCLRAVYDPSRVSFDKAILACSEAKVLNLAAMMNEHCARFVARQRQGRGGVCELEKEYLRRALWLYTDWGAMAKVNMLKEQHEFLRRSARTEPPTLLHTLLASTSLRGFVPVDDNDDDSFS